MTKEFEALHKIAYKCAIKKYDENGNLIYWKGTIDQEYMTIENALKRLEAIDNANPSEALVSLEFICRILNEKEIDIKWIFKNEYNTIKQALIKAQEQEKMIEIIKKKNVMVYALKVSETVNDYNDLVSTNEQLTEEEFELLKRWRLSNE